jgi:hypothetical protein
MTGPQQPDPNQPGFGQQYPGYQPQQQPGYGQPGYPPGYQPPAAPQPGYQPAPQQPGYQQPGPQQPTYQQPGTDNPGYDKYSSHNSGYQNPGYQQAGPQQPGYQQAGYGQPQWQAGVYSQAQPGFPQQQPGKSRKGVIIAVVVALVVVGGGLGTYFGFFAGKSSSAKPSVPAAGTIGDVSTIDPCSVISLNTFSGQAAPKSGSLTTPVAIYPYSFSGCESEIVTKANQNIIVDINDAVSYTSRDIEADTVTTTASGTWHVAAPKDTSDDTGCDYWTYQDKNGLTFEVSAQPGDESSSAPNGAAPDGPTLCNMAHLTTTAVITAMQKGTFKHLTYGTGSLASTVGCNLLSTAQVGSALSISGLHTDKAISRHECTWDTSLSASNVPYAYFVPYVYTSQPDTSSDSQIAYIANHVSLLNPIQQESGSSLVGCTIETPAKQWPKWPGTLVLSKSGTLYEYATLTAYITGSDPSQACTAVKALAQDAWPKLPPYKS